MVKEAGAYVIIRELHLEVEDESVREVCERVVQVLMGDEGEGLPAASEATTAGGSSKRAVGIAASAGKMVMQREEQDDDDDDKIVEIF